MKSRIANIVVTGDLGYPVDLCRLSSTEKEVSYNPEKFQGLCMKVSNHSVILFPKGKFNIVGIASIESIPGLLQDVEKVCEKYKIGDIHGQSGS